MEKLNAEMKAHFEAVFESSSKALVFGEGMLTSKLIMIGEAPGAQEALMGRPFVGKAGKNLDEFLEYSHLKREEIYITNTVKFRPTKISNAGREVNRPPTRSEIEAFLPWLKKEIELIKPVCVATLGNVPLKALLGNAITIGEIHGTVINADGINIFPMYHPASIIYNRALRETYLADIVKLGEWLKEHA